MAKLPPGHEKSKWNAELVSGGLDHESRGKIREGFGDSSDPERLLFLATDGISIFNFVLPAEVQRKGEVLTNLSHFVATNILQDFASDMILPELDPSHTAIQIRWQAVHPDIPWERCTLVNRREVEPIEAILRRHPGGSIWDGYLEDGIVAGQKLSPGLTKWQQLSRAVFTPTDKSEDDDPLTIQEFLAKNPEYGQLVIDVMDEAHILVYEYFRRRGIRILDTKKEYSIDRAATEPRRTIVLVDEKYTPDSSRFVEEGNWRETLGTDNDPAFQDKEKVRIWGKGIKTPFEKDGEQIVGLHKLKGSNPEHVAFVHGLTVPKDLLQETSEIYLHIFEKAVGADLDAYLDARKIKRKTV